MANAVVFVLTLLAVPTVYAADHIVGGISGWNQGVNFANWASGKRFEVGDNLVFNYGSSHSVDEVGPSDYKSCTTSNALKSYKGGQTTVPLESTGPMYFLCPTFGHCSGGMKLSINVVPSTATTTPATPTPPKTETPPSTPESSTRPKTSSPKPSGATGGYDDMNKLIVGMCCVLFLQVGWGS